MKVFCRLRPNITEERRIIQHLQSEDNVSAIVRQALIEHYEGHSLSNAALSSKLDRILRLLENGTTVTHASPTPTSQDGLDYLDNLGL